MNPAHRRLVELWDALEICGAAVNRIPLDTITAHTATRLAAAEERRLRVLADEFAPGPAARRNGPLHRHLEDVLALVHHAMTTEV